MGNQRNGAVFLQWFSGQFRIHDYVHTVRSLLTVPIVQTVYLHLVEDSEVSSIYRIGKRFCLVFSHFFFFWKIDLQKCVYGIIFCVRWSMGVTENYISILFCFFLGQREKKFSLNFHNYQQLELKYDFHVQKRKMISRYQVGVKIFEKLP